MKIKTILKLGVLVTLLILLVLGLWVVSISKSYEDTKKDAEISKLVNSTVFKSTILSSDYLLYYQKRAAQQWKSTYLQLSKILTDPEINHLNELVDLKSLRKAHVRSFKLFERIEKSKKKELENPTQLLIEQRKALSEKLLSTSQLMSLKARQLAEAIEVKRDEIEEQLFYLTVITFFVFLITLVVSWYIIACRIVQPVEALKNYITNIDGKNLDEKYDVVRNDEVGLLINAFNNMAQNLFNTTVSKEKLEKEIKEKEKSQKELTNQQKLNASVLEGAGNIIIILDIEGNVIQFNHSAEKLTGFSREELIGKPIWDFVIPKEEYEDVKEVFDALKGGDTAYADNHENHWVTKDGEYRLIEWHNSIIRDENKDVTHIVAIGYDITGKRFDEIEKQRIQRELNQSRKMEALGKLTGGIAHDFNNMLGIIIGYTDLALHKSEKNNDSDFTSYLEQIKTASNRAKDLIAKMLSFSRVDQAASHALQLAPLLDENILLVNSILPSTIKLEVSKQDNVQNIMMDPVQFQQILMNLIINAKDAMDGVGKINISLANYNSSDEECTSCHQKITGNWVEIVVADNGSGMSKEVEERIFDPFFTTKALGQGTGMGLSVLHGIVKGHNGHIIVESTLGKGTRFRLLFPAIAGEAKSLSNNVEEDENHIHGNGQRILIIDDQVSLADIEYDLLTSYGYKCTKKYDSEEALNLFLSDSDAFDLIITDQTMPNLTGLELISCIRKNEINIPIIIVTGYSDKIKDNKLDIKNVTLLLKPVETNKLLANVARVLGLPES